MEFSKPGAEVMSRQYLHSDFSSVPDSGPDYLNSVLQELPLRSFTPPQWALQALNEPVSVLNDHAHLEKKAAANALELLFRWPHGEPPDFWVRAFPSIAADESEHLRLVSHFMLKRGFQVSRNHRNPYAGQLHARVRKGAGRAELTDRLYVAALIEARSCERFIQLVRGCEQKVSENKQSEESRDSLIADMADMYSNLLESEVGHYRAFLRMAAELRPDHHDNDWQAWLGTESTILEQQEFYSGILSGLQGLS